MPVDQEKLKARRERQNQKIVDLMDALKTALNKIGPIPADRAKEIVVKAMDLDVKRRAKIDAHNRELHKTSAYLAEEARATERAIDRKRWSHSL
jgi:hypothetical protein